MSPTGPWMIAVTLRAEPPVRLDWLERTLRPELAREVPRASARLSAPGPDILRLQIEANDTGAARAAVATFLGWVHLAWETRARARAASGTDPVA